MQVRQIISLHPDVQGKVNEALIAGIEECNGCAKTCVTCADASLTEEMIPELRQRIRLNLDCSDTCLAAGALGSRQTGSNEIAIIAVLDACATACRLCADECKRHAAQHQHCRLCADACRRCEQAGPEAIRSIQQL